jgi:tetratricopeptide (TPR) repeat protein
MAAYALQTRAYRFSEHWYQALKRLGGLLVALLAVDLLLLSPWAHVLGLGPRVQSVCHKLLWGLLLSGLAGLLLCFAFPAWHSVSFRYLMWWSARGLGALRRIFTTAALLLVSFTIAFLYLALHVLNAEGYTQILFLLVKTLLLLVLLTLPYSAYRARKRLVISDFSNHTGDPAQQGLAEGLGSRLRAELVAISTMYSVLDEAWSPESDHRLDLTPSVQDLGDPLKGLVTPDSKISLGFVQIPLAPVLTAFSRLMKGPRLGGGLHRSSSGLLVVAELSGGGTARSWTIGPEDLAAAADPTNSPPRQAAAEPDRAALDGLPELLAYRILTDLAPIGPTNWRAVKNFTLGLAAYRETRRTDRDQPLKLLQAEQYLLQSLDDDKTFARCHYNLGLVYRQRGNLASAEAAFRTALKEGHETVEACLALADTCLLENSYDDSLLFCEKALRSQLTSAPAWNLAGLTSRLRRQQEVRQQEIATALSWRALCAATASGRKEIRLTETAVRCLHDLAIACAGLNRLARSERLLRQALELAPQDRSIQVELGKVLFDRHNYKGAIEFFKSTSEGVWELEQQARQELRAMAANLHLHQQEETDSFRTAAAYHYFRFLDQSTRLPLETRENILGEQWQGGGGQEQSVADYDGRLRAAYDFLKSLEQGEGDSARLQKLREPLAELVRRLCPEGNTDDRQLATAGAQTASLDTTALPAAWRQLANAASPRAADADDVLHDWNWALAQVEVKLAQSEPLAEARKRLEGAIDRLSTSHRDQIRTQGLHGQLGWQYLQLAQNEGDGGRGFLDKALFHAEKAVALEPQGAWERTRLAEIYLYLHDFERAESELTWSIRLKPNDSATLRLIAVIYWRRGVELREVEPRRQALLRGTSLLSHALALIGSEPLTAGRVTDQVDERAWAHYWLGIFYGELMMYSKAIAHLKVALSLGFKLVQATIDLASCYDQARAYDQAQQEFRKALAQARTQHSRTRSWSKPAAVQGEELPINTLLVIAYLGLAFLYADLGVNLGRAERLTLCARLRLARMNPETQAASLRDNELRARYHECLGALHFRRGELDQAIDEIERAVALYYGSLSYLLLARYRLAKAKSVREGASRWRELAREACLRVRETDVRGEYAAEIAELLGELKTPSPLG